MRSIPSFSQANHENPAHICDNSAQSLIELASRYTATEFREQFQAGMESHRQEIAAILASAEDPTFQNTIAALEASGRDLAETSRLFGVVAGTSTNKDIQALEREIMPELSRHGSAIALNPQLFARVQAVYDGEMASPALSREDRRLLERTYRGLLRSGAKLSEGDRVRFADIGAELSELGTAFSQNILADEADWSLDLEPDDLGGLPGWLVSSLAAAAHDRGKSGHVLTLSRSLVVPFLTYSDRADLREKAFTAWTKRGENEGPSDNRKIMETILKLRQEKAALLGFESYAAYKLDDQMAKEPDNVRNLLMRVWEPARERAEADAVALAEIAREVYEQREFAGEVEVVEFIEDMASAYEDTHLMICRAGATTIAEVLAFGLPAIYIPFPGAADDHQTSNALALTEQGAGVMVPQSDLTPDNDRLGRLLQGLMQNPESLGNMATRARSLGRPGAGEQIARECLELMKK